MIATIYNLTKDPALLSYAMDAALDTGFSLSYRDEILRPGGSRDEIDSLKVRCRWLVLGLLRMWV